MCNGFGQSTAVIGMPDKDRKAAQMAQDRVLLGGDVPPPAPDMADDLLKKAGATSLLRQQSKQGRKSTFLSGSMGDVTSPLITKKSTLGSY